MSEWQPIDTCPQDGTWFLSVGRSSNIPCIIRPIGPGSGQFEDFWGGGWFDEATHWMPLPEPPK